ncbi:hypothetical protein FE257_003898 [Aspergillus nanangensis]|uniref:Xylanolytic transcriptional activator regulatory domain-containing protein n=1 Tax=Aspergillus nanangensis TaxID=2582783 RepID=A0AAD4CBG7_ASPNN|nr:hypothetical protein FE257_003898 [Aspergillus nanangensis]
MLPSPPAVQNAQIARQVQDLEKQLSSTKHQLQQLRSGMLRSENLMDMSIDGEGQPQLKFPGIAHSSTHRPQAPMVQDLTEARANMRNYGRGIIKVPAPYRRQGPKSLLASNPPQLPPKDDADRLLNQYYTCIHSVLPVIHWPSFHADYEKVYQAGTLLGVPREWAAVLFGVLACGSLHTLDELRERKGKEFVRISCGVIDVWQDNFTLDQARAALLVSIFLYEVNAKSASWVWIGSAVRVAQEIGLHVNSGPWPALEGEMRKRVWWGMYAWDRLLALEMGKPVLINDQDCDVGLPNFGDDQTIAEEDSVPENQQKTPLLATIHVVRSIGQLTRTIRSCTIRPATIDTFERYFYTCLDIFPPQHRPDSHQYLDPRSLAPIIHLQNARLILHRHNISPHCNPEARASALDYCVSTARDTANILEFDVALVCVQALAVVGDSRSVNAACGRYIAFFLRCLLDRLSRGDPVDLERDEELMVYVSGDMQGTNDGSWVWQGSDTSSQLDASIGEPTSNAHPTGRDNLSTGEVETWEGWDWVEKTVQYLSSEKQRQQVHAHPQPTEYQRETTPFSKPNDPAYLSPQRATESDESTPQRTSSSHARMTIASII